MVVVGKRPYIRLRFEGWLVIVRSNVVNVLIIMGCKLSVFVWGWSIIFRLKLI